MISLLDIFLNSDNLFNVYLIKLGSFFFPLIGTGAKNGLSVSTSSLSKGIFLKVS
jgi:hypothetical protein